MYDGIKIEKATITDEGQLKVTYKEPKGELFDKHTKDCSNKVHQDMKNAFAQLNNHLALLTFQLPETADEAEVATILMGICCTGYSIGGNGDTEGVTLIGQRTLPNAKVLNITSPFQRYDSDSYEYADIDELRRAINKCREEVILYLFEEKYAPDVQLQLEF